LRNETPRNSINEKGKAALNASDVFVIINASFTVVKIAAQNFRLEKRKSWMLSKTLVSGLEHYKIGPKIRALRLKKQLGLVRLGEHAGLSPAMLSKIERNALFPTLPTLLRIAMVFGVGLEHFFSDTAERPLAVVRRKDRLRLPNRPGKTDLSYLFESLNFLATDRKIDAYYAEFPVNSRPAEAHQHAGAELIYLIKGALSVSIDGTDVALNQGDAIYFDSAALHSYRRRGRFACSALVVVSPL
jgi:transcriptional regulator with XRE-family HTH domain